MHLTPMVATTTQVMRPSNNSQVPLKRSSEEAASHLKVAILEAKALKVLKVNPILNCLKQDILHHFCPIRRYRKRNARPKQEESRRCPKEAEGT